MFVLNTGQKNTQILDLYLYLNKIQLYRGMDILKQYVPAKHHLLIRLIILFILGFQSNTVHYILAENPLACACIVFAVM